MVTSKKKLTRVFALLLTTAMLLSVLAGCGQTPEQTTEPDESQTENVQSSEKAYVPYVGALFSLPYFVDHRMGLEMGGIVYDPVSYTHLHPTLRTDADFSQPGKRRRFPPGAASRLFIIRQYIYFVRCIVHPLPAARVLPFPAEEFPLNCACFLSIFFCSIHY